MTISPEDRAAWLAATAKVDEIEAVRAALLAPTRDDYDAAREALAEVEERTGEPVCTCEACAEPVFEGDPWFGGETPLCGKCAPTYADLLNANELSGFVTLGDDGDYRPMTADEARAIYDLHIAAGGQPSDSMAWVSE